LGIVLLPVIVYYISLTDVCGEQSGGTMPPYTLWILLLITIVVAAAVTARNNLLFKERLKKGFFVELDFTRSNDPELDNLLDYIRQQLTAQNIRVRTVTNRERLAEPEQMTPDLEFGGTLRPTGPKDDLQSNRTLAGEFIVPLIRDKSYIRIPADDLQKAGKEFVTRVMNHLRDLAKTPSQP
jgi:hypothetical protein